MLSCSLSQGFGAANGSSAKGAAVNVSVGLCTVGVPQAGSPHPCAQGHQSPPKTPKFCALDKALPLIWILLGLPDSGVWGNGDGSFAISLWTINPDVIRRGWTGAESWELLHSLHQSQSYLAMLIFYIIGFFYLVICFSVLAGDELWFRFKCRGWPGLPGMFCGSLKGKTSGSWSLDFFFLKKSAGASYCLSFLSLLCAAPTALLPSWQEGWRAARSRGRRKTALAFGKGSRKAKKKNKAKHVL